MFLVPLKLKNFSFSSSKFVDELRMRALRKGEGEGAASEEGIEETHREKKDWGINIVEWTKSETEGFQGFGGNWEVVLYNFTSLGKLTSVENVIWASAKKSTRHKSSNTTHVHRGENGTKTPQHKARNWSREYLPNTTKHPVRISNNKRLAEADRGRSRIIKEKKRKVWSVNRNLKKQAAQGMNMNIKK